MKTDKPSRRVARTRQLLSDALIELILEKSYDAITVQDIVDRANVGRSTFYAHYRDKEDLLLAGFERVIDALSQHVEHVAPPGQPPGQTLFPSLALFRHVRDLHALYKAMVWGRGVDILFKHGQRYLSERIEQRLVVQLQGQPPAVPTSILAHYLAGSFLTLLKWWLDHKLIYSPERMDEIFQQLAMPGVTLAIGKAE
jgi:AcrR family transcriptional regulator